MQEMPETADEAGWNHVSIETRDEGAERVAESAEERGEDGRRRGITRYR